MEKGYLIHAGSRHPLGVKVRPNGVNFAIISPNATAVSLLLYERHDSPEPFLVIELDPETNRTFIFWHVFVEGLQPGVHYTWRVDAVGTDAPVCDQHSTGRELVDPWAVAVTDSLWDRARFVRGESHAGIRAMVVDAADDRPWPPSRDGAFRSQDAIIYELHVGGFTLHPSAGIGVERQGTFAGVVDKIPYLQALGITHVELMPVMAFDVQDVPAGVADKGLQNYWGYSTHSFFSPHPHYCVDAEGGGHLREFRAMVDALHEANIEVILDVVFNHTAEAGMDGPVINFKGLFGHGFYHIDTETPACFRDYTGCGNTVNCNTPMVTGFLVQCLEFWAREMRVDGFRFDLASVMSRGEDGEPMAAPPLIWAIELSPQLSTKRIIAEAWDAVGLYQVGHFPGYRWAEWNGRYRDVMRRFVRGDPGLISEVATRLAGSADYYQGQGRHPFNSVNFITCHDGFTLWDLVSYSRKYNLANGEDNRDGHNDNLSWNCGAEGETDDPAVLRLRQQQARNFLTVLMLSQGIPMLLSGDEVLRSQRGNNNTWCQNNDLGWFDWTLTERNAGMLRFTREIIALRKRHPALQRRQFLSGEAQRNGLPDIRWHGHSLDAPLWDDPGAQVLGFTLAAVAADEPHLHVMLNMSEAPLEITLPELEGRHWCAAVDTAAARPADIIPPEQQVPVTGLQTQVQPRSVRVWEGR